LPHLFPHSFRAGFRARVCGTAIAQIVGLFTMRRKRVKSAGSLDPYRIQVRRIGGDIRRLRMPPIRSDSTARVTLVAGDSLFAAGLAHAAMAGMDKVSHLFPDLFARQNRIRQEWEWEPADQLVFVAAVDLSSDRQGGLLQKAADAGAIVDPVDYRDYFPGPVLAGTSGVSAAGKQYGSESAEDASGDVQPRLRPSLVPRLSFLLGGVAGRLAKNGGNRPGNRAEILVIGHQFELKDSLIELRRRGAEVGIAFYRSLMEPRWERFGLFRSNCPIKFCDLGPHVDEITTLGFHRPAGSIDSARSAAAQLF
jgi:hypothetical protein